MKLSRLVSILAIAYSTPIQAQGTLVTASRVTDDPKQIGSTGSVLETRDLQKSQSRFITEALQDVPGVVVSTSQPGELTNISIRGSQNDEVLWLIDGIELGDPSAISTSYQAEHLVTADVSRIEVIRGNQSSLYGSDAIGGVINIITQRAREEGVQLNAEAEAGSYGTFQGGASVLGRRGALDYRLTVSGYQDDGPSQADPSTATSTITEEDGYTRYGASGRLEQVTDRLSLQTIGFWQKSSVETDNTTSDSADFAEVEQYAGALQAVYRTPELNVQFTGSRYETERLYFGEWNPPEGDSYQGTKDRISLTAA